MSPKDPRTHAAAARFAAYFDALRNRFPERERIIEQIELALLAREHVLIFGPPGTGKSELAATATRGVVDSAGLPSVYSRQIVETTVQQDLLGPVDFKILTETGRTRYRVEEGLLSQELAVIDEVFDARDLLLRSLFSVLNEREFAAGATTHRARLSTALFTTNRYLSELLAARPDTLLAFSDRVAFAGFVPKGFASQASRLTILRRAAGQASEFTAQLPLDDLALLREEVGSLPVDEEALTSLGTFADLFEHALLESSGERRMVPTRYLSGRALAKGVIIWRAAVVRDRLIYGRPGPVQVSASDLALLKPFFGLGAPPADVIDGLLAQTQDPRDQAQLKLALLEDNAFGRSLTELKSRLIQDQKREEADLGMAEIFRSDLVSDSVLAGSLAARRLDDARQPKNREKLLKLLLRSAEGYLTQGSVLVGERGSGDRGEQLMALILGLKAHGNPELARRVARSAEAEIRADSLSVPLVESAEEFEPRRLRSLKDLVQKAQQRLQQFERAEKFLAQLAAMTDSAGSPADRQAVEAMAQSRRLAARAFRRRAGELISRPKGGGDWQALPAEAKPLAEVDHVLSALSPGSGLIRQNLVTARAAQLLRLELAAHPVGRVHDLLAFTRDAESRLQNLEIESAPVLRLLRLDVSRRVRAWLGGRPVAVRPRDERCSESGYLQLVAVCSAAVDRANMTELVHLVSAGADPELTEVIRRLEHLDLAEVGEMVRYLDDWFQQVASSVPPPGDLESLPQAEAAWAQVSNSRFFQTSWKEHELVNLQERLRELAQVPAVAAGAQELVARLDALMRACDHFGRALLDRRAALASAA